MFPVEVHIRERDDAALTARMNAMREWLDHSRFEPSAFHYIFKTSGLVFRVAFRSEAQAAAFANAFGGSILTASAAAEAAL